MVESPFLLPFVSPVRFRLSLRAWLFLRSAFESDTNKQIFSSQSHRGDELANRNPAFLPFPARKRSPTPKQLRLAGLPAPPHTYASANFFRFPSLPRALKVWDI